MDVGCEWFYSPTHLSIEGTFSNNNIVRDNNNKLSIDSNSSGANVLTSASRHNQSNNKQQFINKPLQQLSQPLVCTKRIITSSIAQQQQKQVTTATSHNKPRPSSLNINRIRLLNKSFSCQRQLQRQDELYEDLSVSETDTLDEYDQELEERLLLGETGAGARGCPGDEQNSFDDSGLIDCSEYTDILEEDENQQDHLSHNSYHHLQHLQYYKQQFHTNRFEYNQQDKQHNNKSTSLFNYKQQQKRNYSNQLIAKANYPHHNHHQSDQTYKYSHTGSNLKLNFLSKFLTTSDYIEHQNQHDSKSTHDNNLYSPTDNNDNNNQVTMTTVRPISPQYQHTLDSAISLAKELASKNMADSGESSPKTPNSPDKKRFNFKLKHFSKSFSEASANIRDIESSISNDERQAYDLLIGRGPYNNSSLSSSSSSSSSISSHARSSSYTMHHQSQPFVDHHQTLYNNHHTNYRSRPQPFGYGNCGSSGACNGALHNYGAGSGAGAGVNASNTFSVKKSFFM